MSARDRSKTGTTVYGLSGAVPWNVPGRSVERGGGIILIFRGQAGGRLER